MDKLNILCLMMALCAVIAACCAVWLYRRQMVKLMAQLGQMVDEAVNGSLDEHLFDESQLSAVEARLKQYLTQCAVSSQSLAKEKDKIKSLIADISHQTKTPIANILLYAQLLSEYELPETCKPCIQALTDQAEKLNFLISALVKMSRLETGIITVTPKPCQIEELLTAAIDQITPKAQEKQITLIQAASTKTMVLCDPKWTIEALYNVLDNAVKYAPPDSVVTMTIEPYKLFCRIDITDQGPGITEEEWSKIFSRFYRSPAVSDHEGVGIGLYLTREILSAQSGYIKVASQPQKGSTFSLFLPIKGE